MSHQPLVRSDTLPVIELPWSNNRPSTGPTPIPPRNEPLFYAPRYDEHPTLLKLLYLCPTSTLQSSVTPEFGITDGGQELLTSMTTTPSANGTGLLLLCPYSIERHAPTGNDQATDIPQSTPSIECTQSMEIAQEVRSSIYLKFSLNLKQYSRHPSLSNVNFMAD